MIAGISAASATPAPLALSGPVEAAVWIVVVLVVWAVGEAIVLYFVNKHIKARSRWREEHQYPDESDYPDYWRRRR